MKQISDCFKTEIGHYCGMMTEFRPNVYETGGVENRRGGLIGA
jgi:hypothetical protein